MDWIRFLVEEASNLHGRKNLRWRGRGGRVGDEYRLFLVVGETKREGERVKGLRSHGLEPKIVGTVTPGLTAWEPRLDRPLPH
jgi:hypothetical protein